jgi:hypothetical protein
VHDYCLFSQFCVRGGPLRTLFLLFGPLSRSRELLAYTFPSNLASFAFARTSCVHVSILFDQLRVRENLLRARFHPIWPVSRSRELLAYTFPSYLAGFAFARTSCVHVSILFGQLRVRENFLRTRFHPIWTGFAFARTSCVHVSILFGQLRVRENLLRARFHPIWPTSRSREPLACTFPSYLASFAFARTSCGHVSILLATFAFAGTSCFTVPTFFSSFRHAKVSVKKTTS